MFLQSAKHAKANYHEEKILFDSLFFDHVTYSKSPGILLHEREVLTVALHELPIEYQLPHDCVRDRWRQVLLKGRLDNGAFSLNFTDILTGYTFSDQSVRELINAHWKFRKPYHNKATYNL